MNTSLTAELTTIETAEKLGLNAQEFVKIEEILGRNPNFTELSIFSVMWSEHCSYKNSILQIKTLPRKSDKLLAEAGEENAGLVDIGDGLACAFKIESHNHPSAIEPYQGAATGVGGIHRDIFTMGARPIAALNSLRFGKLTEKRTRHLLKGVVKGIGDYGNSFGVPTVGGEIYFNECYHTNPLVNVMSVGIMKSGDLISATAEGVGNPVFIVGSSTGKDGIAGAAFASKDITEDSVEDLPAVQVGDPFQEKLLLEASLEAAATGAIVGMQDMGAAGITCSTSEMSAKGGVGMDIHLDKVPTRQKNMRDWEILLSESQERMLVVLEKGRESEVIDVFEKWDLNCVQIGEVTDGPLRYFVEAELVAEIPAEVLVLGGEAPVYEREASEPPYFGELQNFKIDGVGQPSDYVEAAKRLMTSPNIASKRWIAEQYDSMVGTNNMGVNTPADAALVRIKGTKKALALTVDCNSRYVYANPYIGGMMAVAEAARNIVCTGGQPMAITNCLNFGNPYNPHVYWQFKGAIKGMGEACRKFDTPVTGGNVSFYNQSTDDGPVYPTPTIGMLGLLNDHSNRMGLGFQNDGDEIFLLGIPQNDLNSSVYLSEIVGEKMSPCPYFDLDEEFLMQKTLARIINQGMIRSAHDVSEGGLFNALMEASFPSGFGFEIATDANFRKDAYLFGEAGGRVLISVEPGEVSSLLPILAKAGLYHTKLGQVTKGSILVDDENFGSVSDWKELYDNSIENQLT